jgi:hypothetical protein
MRVPKLLPDKKITVFISGDTYSVLADIQHELTKERGRKASQGDAVEFLASIYQICNTPKKKVSKK